MLSPRASYKNDVLYRSVKELRKTNKLVVYKSLILCGMQNKKEYAYCQSYVRTSAVLPDMGHTEKERGESHEWAAGPVAVDNKQSNKYNKNVPQHIDLTWFHSCYCIIFSCHSLHTKSMYRG